MTSAKLHTDSNLQENHIKHKNLSDHGDSAHIIPWKTINCPTALATFLFNSMGLASGNLTQVAPKADI